MYGLFSGELTDGLSSCRLVAAYEENQKLQKEEESSKRKAENGYDR